MEASSSSSSYLFHYSSPSVNSPTASTQNAGVVSGAAASPSLDSSEYPPSLRLKLNITEELIKKIENVINPQQHKSPEKKKTALNFPIARITIGQWTRASLNPNDLRAKFYFARKKLLWQILDVVETEQGGVEKLHIKIEMDWDDVLSLRTCFYSHDDDDNTEILEVEKCPSFFIETKQRPGIHTHWNHLEQDFTQNHSASNFRRHKLYFAHGVLQEITEKLVSGDSFWSKLVNITFPTLPRSLRFDIGYGDSNNLSSYSRDQTFWPNINHPQGFHNLPPREVSFDMETLFCSNNATPMNTTNQLRGSQALHGTI